MTDEPLHAWTPLDKASHLEYKVGQAVFGYAGMMSPLLRLLCARIDDRRNDILQVRSQIRVLTVEIELRHAFVGAEVGQVWGKRGRMCGMEMYNHNDIDHGWKSVEGYKSYQPIRFIGKADNGNTRGLEEAKTKSSMRET